MTADSQRAPLRRARVARRFLGPLALGLALAAALALSCASSPTQVDPRFVSLHNAFAAMGLAQVGPVQQGSLVEGREARLPLQLTAQCTTVVAMGGAGVRDLDVTLVDASNHPVAHDTTHDAQAVVRACVDTPGTYTMVVRMAAGAGDFLAATWVGGLGGTGPTPAGTAAAQTADGTCDAPIPIGAGSYTGNTSHGDSEFSCKDPESTGKELVYRIDVATQKRMTIEVLAHFDSVLYIRQNDCTSEDAEVKCNDDEAGNNKASKVDVVVDPGTYYVFVDGYNGESGTFRMNVALTDVPSVADVCRQAHVLPLGITVNGTTTNAYDHVHASCGDDAKGADMPFHFDVGQRSRVRMTEHSDDFAPIVHVRRVCTDDQTEVGCYDTTSATQDNEAAFVGILDPGGYTVFADSSDENADGRFTLTSEVAPETGSGAPGDGCSDAVPLAPHSTTDVDGDTFTARDDIAGKCSGAGAADVVYRIDLPRRSRLEVRMTREEGGGASGGHVFVLQRTCGDRASELGCGASIDQLLPAGTYFLAVDGATAAGLGKFSFEYDVVDVSAQESACKTAPLLSDGQKVSGDTSGAGNRFATSCGGGRGASSPDRLYRIVLRHRATVRVTLSTPTWDGVLAIRRSCLEPPGSSGPHTAEAVCNNDAEDAHHSRATAVLDPGTYYVLVDGHRVGNKGRYTLEYHVLR